MSVRKATPVEKHPIRIGTAGWTIPREYARRFASIGTHLERYAQVLHCVEVNSSFYRSHLPATYARWAAVVPAHFRFAVKLPRAITHDMLLQQWRAPLDRFLEETSALGDKLGLFRALAQGAKTSTELAAAVCDPARTPILLYPGDGATDIARHPPPGPVTLIVVDGTWSQTKKVVRTNPILSSLLLINSYETYRTARIRWDYEAESPLRDARGFEYAEEKELPSKEESRLINLILSNGARFYVDHAHPEYSTPECTNARDLVIWDKAGERVLNISRTRAERSACWCGGSVAAAPVTDAARS